MTSEKGAGSTVQSVDRAMTILECLASQGASSVSELGVTLGIHKSTAFRLLSTLEQRGLVTQESERGKYRLGLGLLNLASAVTADLELVNIARPVCEQLSKDTGETVNMSVLDEGEALNVDQVIGDSAIVSMNWLGKKNSLGCTSTGKVLLAFMPQHEQHRHVTAPLERCTKNSILQFEVLEKQLADIRNVGYGFNIEELELGMNAVAAPVRSFDGNVVAAISLSGPSYRMGEERIPELGLQVKKTADEVSALMGWRA